MSPELRHELGIQPELGAPPFTRIKAEIHAFTRNITPVEVPRQLSVEEAASMFEIWMKKEALHTRK